MLVLTDAAAAREVTASSMPTLVNTATDTVDSRIPTHAKRLVYNFGRVSLSI